jgi:hypothetical protein
MALDSKSICTPLEPNKADLPNSELHATAYQYIRMHASQNAIEEFYTKSKKIFSRH